MAISSAASHHHLSPALQGQHDSSIPMQLPFMFGFLGSFICGVLNFGESLTFMLLWNFARSMSWLGSDVTFAKGVIYSQVLNVSSLIPLIVVGWRELLHVLGYSIILMIVSIHFLAVGVHFLIFGHVKSIEAFSAALFMSFSLIKIIQFSIDFGKERAALIFGTIADTPRSRRKVQMDDSETVVLGVQESHYSEMMMGTPHWSIVHGYLQNNPRFCAWYERFLPAVSVRGYAVESVVLAFSFFYALSGMAQGVTGSGGPLRIAAFTVLDISKGACRGMAWPILINSLSLLYDVSRSHGSHLFLSSESHVYAAIGLVGLIGSSLGTWVRQFVPREGILFGMFWLVWAECVTLLHLFDYSSVFEMPALALLYVVMSPVLVGGALVCYFNPMLVINLWSSCLSCCRGIDSANSHREQQPLLKAEVSLHEETTPSSAGSETCVDNKK